MSSVDVFVITKITEPDYDCEESNREKPSALLKLVAENGTEKYFEVPEETLAEQGLAEGKKVTFAADGSIRKYVRVVANIFPA